MFARINCFVGVKYVVRKVGPTVYYDYGCGYEGWGFVFCSWFIKMGDIYRKFYI